MLQDQKRRDGDISNRNSALPKLEPKAPANSVAVSIYLNLPRTYVRGYYMAPPSGLEQRLIRSCHSDQRKEIALSLSKDFCTRRRHRRCRRVHRSFGPQEARASG